MAKSRPAPEPPPAAWLEISRGIDGHGGPGWDLGECIWSPTDDQWGGYRVLTEPDASELVIHCYQGTVCGWSRVARKCRVVQFSPPQAGRWRGMGSYYRLELDGYQRFDDPIALKSIKERFADEIRREIQDHRPKRYPFVLVPVVDSAVKRISTAQGRLIARLTPPLFRLFCQAAGVEPDCLLAHRSGTTL